MAIYRKVHLIMCETAGLTKDVRVNYGKTNYTAVGEASVLNEIKPLLKKHGVVVIPEEVVSRQVGQITTLDVKWRFVDIEDESYFYAMSSGNGHDSADKGAGKAFTYAYKMVLQKTFMMFSGEDTDITASEKIEDDIKKAEQAKKASETDRVVKEAEAKLLNRVIELYDLMDAKTKDAILTGYGIQAIEELPANNYRPAIVGMEKRLK